MRTLMKFASVAEARANMLDCGHQLVAEKPHYLYESARTGRRYRIAHVGMLDVEVQLHAEDQINDVSIDLPMVN